MGVESRPYGTSLLGGGEERGQRFLALDNRSRYPRSCFFDTLYHLNEECQCAHSRAVGRALALLNGPVPMD